MSKIESEPSIKYQIVLQNQPLIVCFLHKQIISAVKNKYILLLGIHQTSLKETWGQSEGATVRHFRIKLGSLEPANRQNRLSFLLNCLQLEYAFFILRIDVSVQHLKKEKFCTPLVQKCFFSKKQNPSFFWKKHGITGISSYYLYKKIRNLWCFSMKDSWT